MTPGRLFVVSAPSGGGKTSLTRALIGRLGERGIAVAFSVSYTTRQPRPGERDGVHYHFVDEATFVEMIARGEFLEHAEVFGRRYGTGRERTLELLAAGQDVILDIDWQGGRQVRAAMKDAIGIFILPPSTAELERRLRGRGTDDDATIQRRMVAARAEMSHYAEYDYLVVNEVFETALDELTVLFLAPRLALGAQAMRHAALIRDLVGT